MHGCFASGGVEAPLDPAHPPHERTSDQGPDARCTAQGGGANGQERGELPAGEPVPSRVEGVTQGAGEAHPDVPLLQLSFHGDGFLKHQVRRMVGLLVRIGRGDEAEDAARLALCDREAFDRRRAPEAPAAGLWLEAVEFEEMRGGRLGSSGAACGRGVEPQHSTTQVGPSPPT